MHYSEFRSSISDGDAILTRAKPTFLSGLISRVQGHNHTHILIAKWDGGRLKTREFREFRGYDERYLSQIGDFDHVRTDFEWDDQTDKLVSRLSRLKYSYIDALIAVLPIPFIGRGLICSEFVVRVLGQQIKLPKNPTPGDLSRWFWDHDYPITKVKAPMKLNRKVFFDELRDSLFKGSISQERVEGTEHILNAWADNYPDMTLPQLAYCLATAWHETAYTMQPIKERGSNEYKRRLYDVSGKNPKRARRMGNTRKGDGVKYCGRGFVQLTWKNNYIKAGNKTGVNLAKDPDKAMIPEHAANIMLAGMSEGWFTGKSLDDYIGKRNNFVYARKIVNGMDKAHAIAAHAIKINRALTAAAVAKPTAEALRKAKSTTIKNADRARDVGVTTTIIGSWGLVERFTEISNKVKNALTSLDGLLDAAIALSPVVIIAGGIGIVYFAVKVIRERVRREPKIGRLGEAT